MESAGAPLIAGHVLPHDARFMRDALTIGQRNLGLTWPNPSVGAVLVREGADGPMVLARGATQPGGRPHAEVVALAGAGEAARGATLYVTLEPCSHFGKSPPCAEAVIRAGISRVVSAIGDPNPLVAGHGHALLRAAGIEVVVGVGHDEAHRAHLGHFTRVLLQRPAVCLKLARTADGFAAPARANEPRLMITGAIANARVHLLRAHADAIAVGVGTVLADDPELTVRLPGMAGRSPVRVVFDSALRTPPGCRLVTGARQVPTWIVAAETAPRAHEAALVAVGVEVMRVGADASGRLDLVAALHLLGLRSITRVFCEGGPALGEALAVADLVDEAVIVTGTGRLGSPGLPAIGGALAGQLGRMRTYAMEQAGDDSFAYYERQQ